MSQIVKTIAPPHSLCWVFVNNPDHGERDKREKGINMKGVNHFRLAPGATLPLQAQGLMFDFIKYGNGVAYVLGGFCQLFSYKLIQPKYSKLLIRQMLAAGLGK